ncbi:Gfo/Idh/MocA family oxidoreductase [Paenibacillus zeisoli]|uniref:Gfo/Idh/MocA family oxidoreductase n=1 Tax=Paenibacillus zeisoli TaxID=2496267 RepID=A0A3S1B4T3_9BACL|nr:Gfo/Idh/MocA family oxidoreductase [Paenibacillus zeisoli]RUT29898.1 Gfo/Idh/MocA family oxidoreductase [Paenibacillus zeisoli]
MRIGIIGLGSIAQKAYLPVITAREDIELIFCTRNLETLHQLSSKYRIREHVQTVEELIAAGIDGAFVHTSTESHPAIVDQLLRAGIHVYVDKPVAYTLAETRRIVELSEQTGRILMVGFNRRFAPMYAQLKSVEERRLIILQKNRLHHPDIARRFVLDDFIHVVDTLRFLAPGDITETHISARIEDGKLYHVMLQLDGQGFSCMGIMNRDNGVNEEILEVMNPGNKWSVKNLNATIHYNNGAEQHTHFKDWDPNLYRRGFDQVIDEFLTAVKEQRNPYPSARDALKTHELCEDLVMELEARGAAAWVQE